ncbi:uncharacterized protein LOC143366443 [Andrena cerasifolii]|uniref:uncharacterized protein LOC143366443 n=1 Tax=Andrena cerasifolii TaxID=2819439 RepID=UPI0040382BD9
MEVELRAALVTKKKKKGLKSSNRESHSKHTDTDDSSDRYTSTKKGRVTEDTGKPLAVFDARKAKKFGNTGSTDVEEFASESMDVVVDIHREYKAEKHTRNFEGNDAEGVREESPEESESFKVFSKTSTFRDKMNERLKAKPTKSHAPRKEQPDEIEVVESLDLIEEFHESSTSKNDETKSEASAKRSSKGNSNRSFAERRLPGRRQWGALENQLEEPKKPPRKRWSKDTSVIRLPEAKGISWSISSKENVSPLKRDSKQPSAAARTSLRQKSLSGFDNAAFVAENEQILRIETDYDREGMKIEMQEIVSKLESPEHSPVAGPNSRGSLTGKRASEEATIAVEDLNGSKGTVSQDLGKKKEDAMLDIESFEEDDDGDVSPERLSQGSRNKKRSSERNDEDLDDSSTLQSLEEITVRSNYRSSEESLIRNDHCRIDRKSKRAELKDPSDSESYPNRRTMSTTEDDDQDEDYSGGACDEGRSRSSTRRKKSKHADQQRLHSEKDKKRSLCKNASNSSLHSTDPSVEEGSKKRGRRKKKKKKKDMKYISMTIHRADMLEIDYVTKHPMVKVHIVNAETGKYLKNEDGSSGHLQPMITGKFDFKENKSIVPVWEEELVFEHDFDALLKADNEQVLILFEIIDLLSFAEASFNYDKFGHEGCWYKIAWAFLKPVGRNSVFHIDKKVRLQLYRPRKNLKKFERFHTCEVYTWWKSSNREKYPSSLFVTITSIEPPKLEPVFYQQLSLHDLSDVHSESQKASTRTSDSINLPKWTRLAAQSCKVPNESIFESDVSENGCFFVAFSNDGKYLACSLSEEHDYPIVVYEVETKKLHVRCSGHKTFVYSLHWSDNDKYLLSVSSDQTARIWDIQNQIIQHVEMMPHPSYVYCGKFDADGASVVATGCYDRTARIWIRGRKSKNRNLSQELEGHEGFINSMCFQKNSNLLTADSVGIIILWTVKRSRRASSRKEWHISRKIRVREIDGVIINTIVLHPLESRLLVHSRNNGLRMLDLATGVVLKKYHELNNQRIQTTACISPCGGLILCGGEDSSLTVWNLETGSPVAKYTLDRNFRAVTCVDYHPRDHALAYSTFGSPAPVRVLWFSKDATGDDVGLKMIGEADDKTHNSEIPVRLLNSSVTPRERSRSDSKTRTSEEVPREVPQERSLQTTRSHKFHPAGSPGSILSETTEKHTVARLKLRRLNETEETLKSRSANRLYNIIEKIDRILSNASRSSGDVESGKNFAFDSETSRSKVLTRHDDDGEGGGRVNRRRNKAQSHVGAESHPNSYFGSSTGGSGHREAFELKTLENMKAGDWNAKRRSRSAKEMRRKGGYDDDLSKTFSDSAANCRRAKVHDDLARNVSPEIAESSFILRPNVNGSNVANFRENDLFCNYHSNSSDSVGTYVVEKGVDGNSDEGSIKLLGNEDLTRSDTEGHSDVAKRSESESSVLSNATFTIENELPVPKPRRKKNLA